MIAFTISNDTQRQIIYRLLVKYKYKDRRGQYACQHFRQKYKVTRIRIYPKDRIFESWSNRIRTSESSTLKEIIYQIINS